MNDAVGFWARLFANCLDGVILFFPLTLIFYLVTGHYNEDIINTLSSVYSLFLPILWSGYTIGKKLMHIRIERVDGEKVGIGTMLLRVGVGGAVYAFTFGIGIVVSAYMVAFRDDHRAIHDFIAGTYVSSDEMY